MKKLFIILLAIVALFLTGCSEANVSSQNISNDADNFRVNRRIAGINLITDKYLFVVTGKCSITADSADSQLEIVCKVGENQYQKHFIGVPTGANVTYTVEQLDTSDVGDSGYSWYFRPESLIPVVKK